MTDNKVDIVEFIEKYKGQLCLDACGELVRLVDFYEDEHDYYYKCQTLSHTWSDNGYVCHSAVGWMIPLKGKLTDKEYKYLDRFFALNWGNVYQLDDSWIRKLSPRQLKHIFRYNNEINKYEVPIVDKGGKITWEISPDEKS